MVRLMRRGKHIFFYRKLENELLGQICPLCETFYDEGLHRPCIDICNSEKCLNCIILLKKCKKCPPESKSCQPSPFPLPLIAHSILVTPPASTMPKLELALASPSTSSTTPPPPLKKQEDILIIPKIEAITIKELKKEESPRKRLIGRSLGKGFPKNVRYIRGEDRRKYYCTICKVRWTTKQNKKAHDHGKPKPFRCHLCAATTNEGNGKEFTERSHYNYHMKSTHGINNEPIYKQKGKQLTNCFKLCKKFKKGVNCVRNLKRE